jgi:hypothetical protein
MIGTDSNVNFDLVSLRVERSAEQGGLVYGDPWLRAKVIEPERAGFIAELLGHRAPSLTLVRRSSNAGVGDIGKEAANRDSVDG